ncbi:MAG: SUMF1/EgtB/PvdO family nonheme iron enzyme, partial [Myxococcota bacterium]
MTAGSPADSVPRQPDREPAAQPFRLHGFFIDAFNHSGEPGAIPETGMTWAEARAICKKRDKRLCTELEWERACKGPFGRAYGYAATYRADVCQTGGSDAPSPNGSNGACRSGFGVHDMHGSAANWTASSWGRGTSDELVAVKGGNGRDGELVGRCAYGRGVDPSAGDPGIGFRCCAGEVNPARVELEVKRGPTLAFRPATAALRAALAALVAEEVAQRGLADGVADQRKPPSRLTLARYWTWRPVGNEELVLGGGCSGELFDGQDGCGIIVARYDAASKTAQLIGAVS